MSPELRSLCDAAGVWLSYVDQADARRETGEETARAVLTAMGLPAESEAEVAETLKDLQDRSAARRLPRYVIATAGEATRLDAPLPGAAVLRTEAGEEVPLTDPAALPALPMGIHRLSAGTESCVVLSAPPSLPLPDRSWGVTLPLYGLSSSGLGDYADLSEAMYGLNALGAGFVGVNPVHAGFFPHAREYSPYSPSHRRRFNAAHIAVPGEEPGEDGALVDYADAYGAKWDALQRQYAEAGPAEGFDAYLAEGGDDLLTFATHQALAELHGPHWSDWPEELCTPDSPAVQAFAAENGERIRFHAWLQFEAERQLARAAGAGRGMAQGLYLDIAVGTHPHGAETWQDPDVFAKGVSLGAPPDAFSTDGQTWGLAPLNPRTLIETGFAAFIEMLRRQLRFARLVRIDHILGFERAFWVPEAGGLPGAYVTMPRDALLAISRIEAARAGACIVGEDLGNIPEGLQDSLARSGLLGCRVTMFEHDRAGWPRAAESYAEQALTAFGTHDLPTWIGFREGRDIAAREALGSLAAERAEDARSQRRTTVARLDALLGGSDADDLFAFLARTPSRLVALGIEDILREGDQPNLPGTVQEYPNWRRRLSVTAGDLGADPRMRRAASIMRAAGR